MTKVDTRPPMLFGRYFILQMVNYRKICHEIGAEETEFQAEFS